MAAKEKVSTIINSNFFNNAAIRSIILQFFFNSFCWKVITLKAINETNKINSSRGQRGGGEFAIFSLINSFAAKSFTYIIFEGCNITSCNYSNRGMMEKAQQEMSGKQNKKHYARTFCVS